MGVISDCARRITEKVVGRVSYQEGQEYGSCQDQAYVVVSASGDFFSLVVLTSRCPLLWDVSRHASQRLDSTADLVVERRKRCCSWEGSLVAAHLSSRVNSLLGRWRTTCELLSLPHYL